MPVANTFGEVVLCEFPFTSGAITKIRPALVLFDLPQDAIICRVTSLMRSEPLDVPITDWRAGYDFERFQQDNRTRDAVVRQFEIVGRR